MITLDIFSGDAFRLAAMTAAINAQPYVPGMIGASGLFESGGIMTSTASIELLNGTLSLVQTTARGAPGISVSADRREMTSFVVPHLQVNDRIYADEVLNLRAFGSDSELSTVQSVVEARLAKARRNIDATHEWHRVGALKGIVYDADGTTVLANLFTAFGVSQSTQNVALSNSATKLRNVFTATARTIEDALGNANYTGLVAWCGATFWDSLIEHASVKETYLNQSKANDLRGNPLNSFDFGGITWNRYRGKNGSTPYIADTKAYIVPTGVPDLFITRFAPGDYVETVNTIGLPYYARQTLMQNGKGIDIEAQSNPLHICTRPAAIVEATAT